MTRLELLAPARNADFGKVAVTHGADAVYIGASRFGARADVGNSVADIESLTSFAHLYKAKVYATVNTILYDNDLDAAVALMWQVYEAGIDAFIIQDMGLLRSDLPPLPLIASTQMHNATPERVRFLEQVGFKRAILARELSLDEIRAIRQQTTLELECFVHGALCVSYSGQCYLSHALTGRSGNRGECAQPCRSAYQLLDANDNVLIDKAYLLSVKDLNLATHLSELIEAGVTSFKIEGRLKDLNYLKNITALYRTQLDALMEGKPLKAASSGKTKFFFSPNPEKTFNRGYTDYFIAGRTDKIGRPSTPKAIGERIGKVTEAQNGCFSTDSTKPLHAGDGLCWLHPVRGLEGALVNRVDGKRVFTAKPTAPPVGSFIFRNNDFCFEKQLSGVTAERRIAVKIVIACKSDSYTLTVEDEDGNTAQLEAEGTMLPAQKPEQSRTQIVNQLNKLGNTAFYASEIRIPDDFAWFIPTAELNALRRKAIDRLTALRLSKYKPQPEPRVEEAAPFPETTLDYRANVANARAKAFYEEHGAKLADSAFELHTTVPVGAELMRTKHCIRYQFDACLKKRNARNKWPEPLYLRDNHHRYRLVFDCKNCEMCIVFNEK